MNDSTIQHFSDFELKTLKTNLLQRKKIEDSLNKFQFKDDLFYQQNIQNLCSVIEQSLNIQSKLGQRFIKSFKDFINCEYNIPIEVNLKCLKYQQLMSLFEEWENFMKQPSLIRPQQRLYTINHRNILFSRVFVEQRNNIEEYFQTLSDKKMLKAVDLYQLLADILSHYFLYEYESDNETFFQKVNSFNNFIQIVQQFKHSQKRIIIDNKSKDFEYIKIYEFQALINFWQEINRELQLCSDRRFSICNVEVQTERHKFMPTKDNQTQTSQLPYKKVTLQETINDTLKLMNKLTQELNQPQKLQIIQNICQMLRKQKIKLCQIQLSNKDLGRLKPFIQETDVRRNYQNQQLNGQSQQNKSQSQKTEKLFVNNVNQLGQHKQKLISASNIDERTHKYQNKYPQNYTGDRIRYQNHKFSSKFNHQKSGQKSVHSRYIFENKNKPKSYLSNLKQRSSSGNRKERSLQRNNNSMNKSKEAQIYFPVSKKQSFSMLYLLQKIYNYYMNSRSENMEIEKLNQFFIDIGVIQPHETSFIFNLIKNNFIKNLNQIKLIQFIKIMQLVMKEDKQLSYQVIEEFVDCYISEKTIDKHPQPKQIQNEYHYVYRNRLNDSSNNRGYGKSPEKISRRFKYYQQPSFYQTLTARKSRIGKSIYGQSRYR